MLCVEAFMITCFELPFVVDLIWFDLTWLDLIWLDLIWFDLIWFDLIWFDLIWFDLIWFDLILFDLIWFDLIWFDLIWFDLIWFDLIWFDLIWFDLIWFDLMLLLPSVLFDMIQLCVELIWQITLIWLIESTVLCDPFDSPLGSNQTESRPWRISKLALLGFS